MPLAVLGMASRVYSLLERNYRALLVCKSKPRQRFTVWFQIFCPLLWANKSDTVRLSRLRRGNSLVCAARYSKTCMISRQSWILVQFGNNCTHNRHKLHSLSLVQLFPNCTRILVITNTNLKFFFILDQNFCLKICWFLSKHFFLINTWFAGKVGWVLINSGSLWSPHTSQSGDLFHRKFGFPNL